MGQKAYNGLSLLENSKNAIEFFIKKRQSDNNKLDIYNLFTTNQFDQQPFSDNNHEIQHFYNQLKNITTQVTTDTAFTFQQVYEFSGQYRILNGCDNVMGGRDLYKIDPYIIIFFTDNSDVFQIDFLKRLIQQSYKDQNPNTYFPQENFHLNQYQLPFQWDQNLYIFKICPQNSVDKGVVDPFYVQKNVQQQISINEEYHYISEFLNGVLCLIEKIDSLFITLELISKNIRPNLAVIFEFKRLEMNQKNQHYFQNQTIQNQQYNKLAETNLNLDQLNRKEYNNMFLKNNQVQIKMLTSINTDRDEIKGVQGDIPQERFQLESQELKDILTELIKSKYIYKEKTYFPIFSEEDIIFALLKITKSSSDQFQAEIIFYMWDVVTFDKIFDHLKKLAITKQQVISNPQICQEITQYIENFPYSYWPYMEKILKDFKQIQLINNKFQFQLQDSDRYLIHEAKQKEVLIKQQMKRQEEKKRIQLKQLHNLRQAQCCLAYSTEFDQYTQQVNRIFQTQKKIQDSNNKVFFGQKQQDITETYFDNEECLLLQDTFVKKLKIYKDIEHNEQKFNQEIINNNNNLLQTQNNQSNNNGHKYQSENQYNPIKYPQNLEEISEKINQISNKQPFRMNNPHKNHSLFIDSQNEAQPVYKMQENFHKIQLLYAPMRDPYVEEKHSNYVIEPEHLCGNPFRVIRRQKNKQFFKDEEFNEDSMIMTGSSKYKHNQQCKSISPRKLGLLNKKEKVPITNAKSLNINNQNIIDNNQRNYDQINEKENVNDETQNTDVLDEILKLSQLFKRDDYDKNYEHFSEKNYIYDEFYDQQEDYQQIIEKNEDQNQNNISTTNSNNTNSFHSQLIEEEQQQQKQKQDQKIKGNIIDNQFQKNNQQQDFYADKFFKLDEKNIEDENISEEIDENLYEKTSESEDIQEINSQTFEQQTSKKQIILFNFIKIIYQSLFKLLLCNCVYNQEGIQKKSVFFKERVNLFLK
ncbi:hypothetical protein PPERSA_11940 [Pseudocohnilembus persalinus]|uniref:Uncharacterized protein n=1 Tax=Pseudocohnilembus persalinus TaxID=266149 RepID=A0A0V0QKH4_PSEPJ|nr:hypothetical protein PPERSA_11940 [Pseudocohnilembus persalinus]|eukprot:KRX02600.1 hypothetical protein PPERSA_11940 [Pseudocohnilembus persalinus]